MKHEDLINIKNNLIFRNINTNKLVFTFINVLISIQNFLNTKNIENLKENVSKQN